MSKYCGNCGHPLSDGAKFCGNCGQPLNTKNEKQNVAAESQKEPVKENVVQSSQKEPVKEKENANSQKGNVKQKESEIATTPKGNAKHKEGGFFAMLLNEAKELLRHPKKLIPTIVLYVFFQKYIFRNMLIKEVHNSHEFWKLTLCLFFELFNIYRFFASNSILSSS